MNNSGEYYRQVSEDLEVALDTLREEFYRSQEINETLTERVAELEADNEKLVDQVADLGATVDRLRLHIAQGVEL